MQGQWATTLAYTGRWRDAGPIAEPLLEHPDVRVRLRALSAATLARLSAGDCPAALTSASDLLSSAYASADTFPSGVRWASVSLISVYLHDGRLADLRALLQAAEFKTVANGPNRATMSLVRGRLALARGHAASARAALRDTLAQLEVVDAEGWSPWAYALLAEAEALLGHERAAQAAAHQSETSRAGVQIYLHDAARARAWALVAAGTPREAAAALLEVGDQAAAAGSVPFSVLAWFDAARLGAAATAHERIATAPQWRSGWAEPIGAHVAGLAQRDPALLAARRRGVRAHRRRALRGLGVVGGRAAARRRRSGRSGGRRPSARSATRHPLRRRAHPGAAHGATGRSVDCSRARGRRAGRAGPCEQVHRGAARDLPPHGRQPSVARVHEDGCGRPRRPGTVARDEGDRSPHVSSADGTRE